MDCSNFRNRKRGGFTIVELLTIMSIIVILIGLLVPGLNKVRRYATKVKQKTQFHGVQNGLELFNAEHNGYPESYDNNLRDSSAVPYCGAMKLAEAMVGKDLLGYNPKSDFTGGDTIYYDQTGNDNVGTDEQLNKDGRTQYIELEGGNANYMSALYGNESGDVANPEYEVVLCDVYSHPAAEGQKGMPVLYYKADTSGSTHPNPRDPSIAYDASTNIYNYYDNDLIADIKPFHTSSSSPYGDDTVVDLSDPTNRAERFYKETWNEKVDIEAGRPYRSDSFILQSAGYDGIYFTGDDVYNIFKGD